MTAYDSIRYKIVYCFVFQNSYVLNTTTRFLTRVNTKNKKEAKTSQSYFSLDLSVIEKRAARSVDVNVETPCRCYVDVILMPTKIYISKILYQVRYGYGSEYSDGEEYSRGTSTEVPRSTRYIIFYILLLVSCLYYWLYRT